MNNSLKSLKEKKKTTDDCYTPPAIYEAVKNWALSHSEVDINGLEIVRPFYPGGDYEHEDYSGKVVIDNPPFSILTQESEDKLNAIYSFK